MTALRSTWIACVLASGVWLSACTALLPYNPGVSRRVLNGTWEGSLDVATVIGPHDQWKWETGFRVLLHVFGANARVDYYDNGKWGEVARPFTVTSEGSNAVITSTYRNRGSDPWIETWSFAITWVDAQQLDVLFQRQVNNTRTARSNSNAVFGEVAYGRVTRAPKRRPTYRWTGRER